MTSRLPRGGLSTWCYGMAASEHERCRGCSCACHEPMPSIRLQLVMTVFLAVIVAISAWLWLTHPEVAR